MSKKRGTDAGRDRARRVTPRQQVGDVRTYFDIQGEQRRAAKRAVADFIVDNYFQEGDSILLDAGTSLWPVAKRIVDKSAEVPQETHFTIMTHNYRAFEILVDTPRSANLNIILAGGRYDQDLNALFGVQTAQSYKTFFPRVVLIGISGFKADTGLFCHGNTEELQVKELIFQKSCSRRIIVADDTKLGLQDSFSFGKTVDMRAGTDECVVVTSKPGQGADKLGRGRYRDEIEKLRRKYEIQVEEVSVSSEEEVVAGARVKRRKTRSKTDGRGE
jgi:DeoR/GlpR family transcriptional regulator of sugar metabolism